MTSDSRSGQRSADGAHRFRALRPSGLRMAAISSALCLAAGAGVSMAGQASAATARPAAATTVAGPAFPSWGHKHENRGIITKVFTSNFVRVKGKNKITQATAFCPKGFVATGGGFLVKGHDNVEVVASFPFPSFNGAVPFAWVAQVRAKGVGMKKIFLKAFVVCTKRKKKEEEEHEFGSH